MTNTEAIQTIREALEKASDYIVGKPSHIPTDALSVAANCQRALAALDSLAVEPSEDVKDLVWKIILLWDNAVEPEEYDKAKTKAAALITARDERIRRECKRAVLRQFEECDGVTGVYFLDGKWYIGKWGCDILEHIIDAIEWSKQ